MKKFIYLGLFGIIGLLCLKAMATKPQPFTPYYNGIALNQIKGKSLVVKFGRNSDIDTVTTPEDVWEGGGEYTGFPSGDAETVECFSDDAD